MDFSKKSLSPNSRFGIQNPTPCDYKRRSIARKVTQEADENGGHFHKVRGLSSQNPGKETKNFNATTPSPISKKKILAQKNDTPFSDSYDLYDDITPQANATVDSRHFDAHSQVMPLGSRLSQCGDQNAISSYCSHLAPYDPLINYTSPRPEFLRYNPNRRKQILWRIEGEMKNEEEGSGADLSSSSDSKKIVIEESLPLQTSFQDKDFQESDESDNDAKDDDTEEEGMEERSWYSRIAWRLFLLLGVFFSSFFYTSCMNYAPVPSLQEYGVIEENYHMIQDVRLDHQTHVLNNFPGNFLGTSIGLSNKCIDICQRELTCAIDDVKWKGSEENESFDGTELVTERDRGALVEDGTLNGVDLVAEEMSEEVGSSNEIEENIKARTDAGSEQVEILGAESGGVHSIAQLLNESSQVSETELIAIDSSVDQDSHIDLFSSLEPDKDFGEEARVMSNLEVVESLQVPPSKMVSSTISNNQKPGESEISNNSVVELKWDRISLFASKYAFQLLYIFTCLSTIIVFNGLQMYLTKFHKNSTPASDFPAAKPDSELASEKKNSSLISAKEVVENKGSDSDAHQRLLAHLNTEHKKFIGVQPPAVELLAEFSVVEGTVSRTSSGQKVRRGSADSAEEAQIPQSLSKMPVKRSPGPSISNKVLFEKKNSLLISAKEEVENKGSDSDAYQRPLAHLNNEHKKFIGVQPPAVELLAQFSVVEGTVSRTSSGQKVRRGSADSAEEAQIPQSLSKMPVKRNVSSSANKVYLSPSESLLAPASISKGNSTAQKLQRKKCGGDKEEAAEVVTTPLRRSSRLRSRAISP